MTDKNELLEITIQRPWGPRHSQTMPTSAAEFLREWLDDERLACAEREATLGVLPAHLNSFVRRYVDSDGSWIGEPSDEVLELVSAILDDYWSRVTAEDILSAMQGRELEHGYFLRSWTIGAEVAR